VGGDIENLDIVRYDVVFEALDDGRGQSGLEIEEEFLLELVNVEVALKLALGGNEGGIAAAADRQILDVIGDLTVQESQPVGARDA
jgi:hypothetical protein